MGGGGSVNRSMLYREKTSFKMGKESGKKKNFKEGLIFYHCVYFGPDHKVLAKNRNDTESDAKFLW